MVSEKLWNIIMWQMLGESNLTMCCSVRFRRTCTQHLHLRPSGARDFGRHRVRGVAKGTQEFCCHREELAVARGGGCDAWHRGCVVTCSWEKFLSHGSAPLGNGCVVTCSWEKVLSHGSAPLGNWVPSTQGKVADHCVFMVPHPGEDGSEAMWDPGEVAYKVYL